MNNRVQKRMAAPTVFKTVLVAVALLKTRPVMQRHPLQVPAEGGFVLKISILAEI